MIDESLTLSLYDHTGAPVLILTVEAFEASRDWAEEMLRMRPVDQHLRFGHFIDGAVIETAGKVIWHCHVTYSEIPRIPCLYAQKAAEYRQGREAAAGKPVYLHVRI